MMRRYLTRLFVLAAVLVAVAAVPPTAPGDDPVILLGSGPCPTCLA